VRQPGSLADQLHTSFLPLLSTFQQASAAAEGLDSLAFAISESRECLPDSFEEHLRNLFDKRVRALESDTDFIFSVRAMAMIGAHSVVRGSSVPARHENFPRTKIMGNVNSNAS
jgi:hypothetical protein